MAPSRNQRIPYDTNAYQNLCPYPLHAITAPSMHYNATESSFRIHTNRCTFFLNTRYHTISKVALFTSRDQSIDNMRDMHQVHTTHFLSLAYHLHLSCEYPMAVVAYFLRPYTQAVVLQDIPAYCPFQMRG